MTRLGVRLLGSFELMGDERPSDGFESDKVRALLAFLAMERDRPHRRESLAALLWPDQPHDTAHHRLRQALTNLRRVLVDQQAAVPALLVDRLAIQLNPARDVMIDVEVFSALLAACRGHRHRDRETCRSCLGRLEEAVALYRGAFLAGLSLGGSTPFDDWAARWEQQLSERALDTLTVLAAHAERRDDHERVSDYARRELALEPWREAAHRRLMRVLAARGDRTAALRQYQLCRRVLARELDVEPSDETRCLARQIGAGRTNGGQPGARRHALPVHPSSFVGRMRDVAGVQDLLSVERLVTLTGVGGVGKTRLALRVAEELAPDFADGAGWVELGVLTDPALVPEVVAAALDLRQPSSRPTLERLEEHLRARRMLLVLDNCEHLVAACAALVDRLLRSGHHLCVLATSREPLGVAGEAVWRVSPLPGPDPTRLATGEPSLVAAAFETESMQLFVERARAVQADFRPGPCSALAVAQICHRLDGLPLAIELAAARAAILGVEQIAERLDDLLRSLGDGSRLGPVRQQTLRASLDWSHNLLSTAEQALFRRLAVFAGDWSLEAAEAVCSGVARDEGRGASAVKTLLATISDSPLDHTSHWAPYPRGTHASPLDLLGHLVDQSLVVVEDRAGATRYRLLETVRHYARERLLESGEADVIGRRHAAYFLELAEQSDAELRGPRQEAWLTRLEQEHDNLRAALDWAEARGDGELLVRLSAALAAYWYWHGHLAEGWPRLARALAVEVNGGAEGGGVPREARMRLLLRGSHFARRQGKYAMARSLLQECLGELRVLGDRSGLVEALRELAWVAFWQGDDDTARSLLAEALDLAQQLGDDEAIAWTLQELGWVLRYRGEDGAVALLEESLARFRQLGHARGIAYALAVLGDARLAQGEVVRARAALAESLALLSGLNDRVVVPYVLDACCGLAVAQGQPERALWHAAAAQAVRAATGNQPAPSQIVRRERWIAQARAALGEAGREAAEAAWAAGQAMTAEQALACALATAAAE